MANNLELNDFIEVDETELAGGIDVSKLQEDTETPEETPMEQNKTNPTLENAPELEVDDTEITNVGNNEIEKIDEDVNPFQAFSVLLKEKGVIPDVPEEELSKINDAESIVNLLNKQLQDISTSWQEQYKKSLLDNLIKDGLVKPEQVTVQKLKRYSEDEIRSDEEKAKATIKEFYQAKGIPDSQIETILDALLDVNEEALKLLPILEEEDKKKEEEIARKIKEKEEAQQKQFQTFNERLKESAFKYEEFIPGRKLNEDDKTDAYQRIPQVLEKINQDLIKYAPVLAYLDKYGILDGKMDTILKEAETKTVNKFSEILTNKKRSSSSRGKSVTSRYNTDMPQIYK